VPADRFLIQAASFYRYTSLSLYFATLAVNLSDLTQIIALFPPSRKTDASVIKTIAAVKPMSALGQKRTCAAHKQMSAKCQKRTLPPEDN
jgi:hypothetical protein